MRTANPIAPSAIAFVVSLTAATVVPLTASAHVKWFCTIADASRPPEALAAVITPMFLACFGAFVLMIFAGFFVDSLIARRWPALTSAGVRFAA